MKSLQNNINPALDSVFNNYPDLVRNKTLNLRNLIFETVTEIEDVSSLEDILK